MITAISCCCFFVYLKSAMSTRDVINQSAEMVTWEDVKALIWLKVATHIGQWAYKPHKIHGRTTKWNWNSEFFIHLQIIGGQMSNDGMIMNFKSIVQMCCMKCRINHRMIKNCKLGSQRSFNYRVSKAGITL